MAPEKQRVLTNDQVTDAMERAITMRCGRLLDPAIVCGTPLNADDAVAATLRQRQRSQRYRVQHWRNQMDPWWMIGWVAIELPTKRRTWEVWLNIETDRIWLKLQLYGRPNADDPYR